MRIHTKILSSCAVALAFASQSAHAGETDANATHEIVVVGALTNVALDREEIEIT